MVKYLFMKNINYKLHVYLDYRKYNQSACVNEKFVIKQYLMKISEKSFLTCQECKAFNQQS